ncbi:MAG: glycosyltransferase [Campylobacterales bacterium]|nr:glycosyltransferase [Campylobacterales bacterium]
MKKISVLLSVRDGELFLANTIDSVLNQTYSELELIVVVNCSTDNSLKIIQDFDDDRVKVYETNICQLSFNLNYALSKASGEYIARIDADDIAMPDRLEKQVKCIEEYNYDVVGSNIDYIDENGRGIGNKRYPESNIEIRSKIFYKAVLVHPSILTKRELLLKNGGYLGGKFAQDYDIWLRIMRDKNIKFYNIQEPLLQYRIHPSQTKGNRYSYAEVAGYLLKESIYSKSFTYFLGAFIYYVKALVK